MTKPVILTILDGWGLSEDTKANAPYLAKTPTMDRLMATCPNATLITHGPDVGLPTGQMGNSEVGHTNIGAGRVVAMDLGQIDLSIEDGSFATRPALVDFITKVKAAGGVAHIMGLVSAGGVHSHENHLLEAARVLTEAGLKVQIHAVTDGRDVAPTSGHDTVTAFEGKLPKGAFIGTVVGRYFAMDRDNRWERVQQAFDLVTDGLGHSQPTVAKAISEAYQRDESDEFIAATKIDGYVKPGSGDGLLFINFRADRAREILASLADPEFDGFETGPRPDWSDVCGMVEYSDSHNTYMSAIFPKQDIVNTLGHWVAEQGKTQFRLAETEKYPHVTFFLNGGVEVPEPNEDRFMPKSPKVATYDLQPEMSSGEVTEKFLAAIDHGYDLIVVNYANPDMVGHTGDLDAAIKACEAVDAGLGQVVAKLEQVGGAMLVIADHGNCECMVDPETGGPHTAHTTNLVPVVLFGGPEGAELKPGRLADVAPTLLQVMDLPKPEEMTGKSLIK
ncbi:2,3-bisphosphoglycerate-independent phosphoglycerate mutase [Tropicibacter sp. R15_0]|uniref:2,3-bisphosphoglycerate-independent phosphoglycerate mutase n=1 Tax=Tropicibacter sp. R15_0 TaxID=2821101 RepID=UPI001ADCA6EF|nr:2,3-bisphosphoglycerate-independent phosphoglycerate mutase [Tropicibacter sp. R15_0]MBO9467565.1 2,3-bisphosphoglycerate-independent phosphoglycerate mutase [Tropicibacter sp. R15_0]